MSNHSQSTLITGARVVLPEGILDNGEVGIDAGRVMEVGPAGTLQGRYDNVIDADGGYVMPGIIDLHNDSLEVEINPRPETSLPPSFALANLGRRLLFSGVTTEFHAISFMNNGRNRRTVNGAAERAERVREHIASGDEVVGNHVLHRLDVWTPDALDVLFDSLSKSPIRYVSINDHTPGQGQYRELEGYRERMAAWQAQRGNAPLTQDDITQRIMERAEDTETVPFVYGRISEERQRLPFVIASHDDDSAEKVDILWELGARVAEFPVTLDAAQRARERGMTIVVGAPNIVRGGSSSGNMDAAELFRLGLADAICADYHAPSLLPSAFRLAEDGVTDLVTAVRALTLNPARALGLEDLGAVLPGFVADLLVVRQSAAGLPQVERVFRQGEEVLTLRSSRRVEVPA